ncbi:stearic acid desaturase [Penicillium canariense]|uniref:Acyl-CoA desaturase n=1 Tax=Penicillium canariense TaxID=189055 RepID=A0A9W9IGN0_9EURO|nr:stearic acid desaturase [Penicillium canariense]KAJ5175570.1 stearic acid desaturase [Penicillium canariense]
MAKSTEKNAGDFTWAHEIRWYCKNLDLFHFIFLVVIPVAICFIAPHVALTRNSFLMALILHIVGGMSITVDSLTSHTDTVPGYHRLWAHRSYTAHLVLQYFLAIMGAAQCQWSILWWVQHHRAHHQYTDTDKDPYDARRGLLFSHIGWLVGLSPAEWGKVDVSDLAMDPVVRWQRRYYVIIAILVCVGMPTAIAHFGWNDWRGGLLYGGVGRTIVTHHSTFLVNSIAHAPWAGYRPYSTKWTATNVPLVAILAAGEGSHNFHHAFPRDYRNGIQWIELDWSRAVIELCEKLGIAWDLVITSPDETNKGQRNHIEQAGLATKITMDWKDYVHQADRGRCLICIKDVVYDIADFMTEHPGGAELLQKFVGKDATEGYLGDTHLHSTHADGLLATRSIGVVNR